MNYLSLKACAAVADLTSILMGFGLRPAHGVHIKEKEMKGKKKMQGHHKCNF